MRVYKVFFIIGSLNAFCALLLFILKNIALGFNSLAFGLLMMYAGKVICDIGNHAERLSEHCDKLSMNAFKSSRKAASYLERSRKAESRIVELETTLGEAVAKIARMEETIDGLTCKRKPWMKKIIKEHYEFNHG